MRRLYLAALVATISLGALLSAYDKISAGTAFLGGLLLGISADRYERQRGQR